MNQAALPPPPLHLPAALVAVVDDVLFVTASLGRLDPEDLEAVAKRRTAALRGVAAGQLRPSFGDGDAWMLAMATAMAPVAPPSWVPLGELVEQYSLERGARGMRSLFTSKPSDKEIAKVKAIGGLAARSLAAVLGSTGAFSGEARLLRASLLAALGLPEADQLAFNQEAPASAEALEITGDSDAKLVRLLLRGNYAAALGDGMDPREEEAIHVIARKAGLGPEEVTAARDASRKRIDAVKDFGEASVDGIRFLLAGRSDADELAMAVARIVLPLVHRRDAVATVNHGGAVLLGHKHKVDKKQREAVLALAWAAALRQDPTTTRRAEFAQRHDALAADLGEGADAAPVRSTVERFVEARLVELLPG